MTDSQTTFLETCLTHGTPTKDGYCEACHDYARAPDKTLTTEIKLPELTGDEKLPYVVELEKDGCSKCGHYKQWCIVDRKGNMIGGQTWGDEEEAIAISELLCDAFDAGVDHAKAN